jgi:glycosyltransferase involved in cell wall biosynthesis
VSATVSVIIPTFNRAYCLARTMASALTQTHADVEVIVVDDGSTDDTAALVARLYGGEPRVRYVHQANAGVCTARNHGFSIATGEFVALLDSDDVWYPWKLELQLACLRAVPRAGMVWTDLTAVDPGDQVTHSRYLRVMYGAYRWFPTSEDLFDEQHPLREVAPGLASVVGDNRLFAGDIFSPMVTGSLVHTSTVLLRRERLSRVGGFDKSLEPAGEDYDFHLRTCREGPVAYADIPSIRYQLGMPDRLSRHRLAVAEHRLETLSRVLREHRDRIVLPRDTLQKVVARAHEWVGSENLELGSHGPAARHLARSLWHRPWQPHTAALLGLALLPRPVVSGMRQVYRRLKSLGRAGATPSS